VAALRPYSKGRVKKNRFQWTSPAVVSDDLFFEVKPGDDMK